MLYLVCIKPVGDFSSRCFVMLLTFALPAFGVYWLWSSMLASEFGTFENPGSVFLKNFLVEFGSEKCALRRAWWVML